MPRASTRSPLAPRRRAVRVDIAPLAIASRRRRRKKCNCSAGIAGTVETITFIRVADPSSLRRAQKVRRCDTLRRGSCGARRPPVATGAAGPATGGVAALTGGAAPARCVQAGPRMARILLIDDDVVVGSANLAALSDAGHEVTLVSTAADGLAAAISLSPAAIVLEALLGGTLVGLNLCRELQRRLPRTPVIVLSRLDEHVEAHVLDGQDHDRGWIAADLYLQKPLAPAMLAETVAHFIYGAH
jgi:CheY-like chemotaxis protein